jgi:ubiquinol-cytochrome c reductase iron-sulfur subunit
VDGSAAVNGASRPVAVALLATIAAALLATGAYWLDWGTQALGASLGLALALFGFAVITWAHRLMPHDEIVEERPEAEAPSARAEFEETVEERTARVGRRSLLGRLAVVAAAALGVAVLSPLRSLGPRRPNSLAQTSWSEGTPLVTRDGRRVRVDDLAPHSILTVFPEGRTEDAEAQAVLIRVEPELLEPTLDGSGTTPGGYVCFSKVCTHAGCAVGLYQTQSYTLLCPCHQAAFDVLDEARPVFGPAPRALPRLPLGIDEDGLLVALGDFDGPVGPSSWTTG